MRGDPTLEVIDLDLGKFPAEFMERVLAANPVADPRVLLGPKVGEDAAVLDMGDRLLVATSDPITFATDAIGWYAVQVNANDIASTGGTPRWFLATILVPDGFSEAAAEGVFNQILTACQSLGVSLIGGHSEITSGIDRPIIMGTMLGEAPKDRLISTGGAQEGDSVLVTKGIAIEGSALLARDYARLLSGLGIAQYTLTKAVDYLTNPGISVLQDSRIALETAQVHSLHDVTEGGLATGLREVAQASNLGVAVEQGSIPVLPECQEICDALGLDPLGLLASGALLITLPAAQAPAVLLALEREGIDGWEIGQMLAPEEGMLMIGFDGEVPLPEFPRDEIARYFSEMP